ncbi:amidohydrolase [Nocardioides ginsengisoli]|uniref:Amidohydrolase n=1 Tax=Nocardioides ginsengisoli TaxID=363868 RepID=A0ABW3VZ05_9ACTN
MSLRLENLTLPGHESPVTLTVADGRIASVVPAGAAAPVAEGVETIDATGLIALPGLIDAHCHIDKTLYSGPWVPTPATTSVHERIAREREVRDQYGLPQPDYVAALVEAMIGAGTTHIRTHTDVDPGVGTRGIEVVADVAKRYADAVTIEQVAFPQGGLITNPGTLELLEKAVAEGATTIGGLDPAGFDGAPTEHLDAIFELAARTGAGIDIHLHDDGALGAWEMGQIVDRTIAYGMAGKVAISHAFGLGHAPTQDALIERFAAAGVAIVSAAVYDVPVPPLDKMAAAGVTFASGSDGINDLWGPFGDGDMLRRANLVAYRNSARTDEGLELALGTATTGAAKLIGIAGYGLSVGDTADLVLVRARCHAEAVARVPVREVVIKAGSIVARDGRYRG